MLFFFSEGLSGAELSDLTLHTEPLTHVVRGLSRRKTQRAFSVSAFEGQLDELPGSRTYFCCFLPESLAT